MLNDFKSPAGDGAKKWQKEANVGGLLFKCLLKTVCSERLTLALERSCPEAREACSCVGDLRHEHGSSPGAGGSTAAPLLPPWLPDPAQPGLKGDVWLLAQGRTPWQGLRSRGGGKGKGQERQQAGAGGISVGKKFSCGRGLPVMKADSLLGG